MKSSVVFLAFFSLFSLTVFSQSWVQRGIDIDGEASGDYFGRTVSMSDDGQIVAIGADGNSESGPGMGHVRVFAWSDTAWVQRGRDLDGEAVDDVSGLAISLSANGKILAIGAPGNDANGNSSGHVRIYVWNDTLWAQRGLDIDGEASGDYSGSSVSLSADGNIVAIGADFNSEKGTWAGHVRVYSWIDSTWTQTGKDIDGDAGGDYSGIALSLSADGRTLAIGAPGNDANGNNSGQVRVFSWNGSSWVRKGSDIKGESSGDNCGNSVSMSSDGNTIAIGAYKHRRNGLDAGHVRVFFWSGSAWVQKGDNIDGFATGDESGRSVCLSNDGNTLAIGSPGNDDSAIDAGHVRVFKWSESNWKPKGIAINGEETFDFSGSSVSMSADGQFLVIGATYNDGNGELSGHARVYHHGWPLGAHFESQDLVTIYPNPFTKNFTLKHVQSHQGMVLKVMDAVGQVICVKENLSTREVKFEIVGKKGIYFVEITSDDGLHTVVKVIKD